MPHTVEGWVVRFEDGLRVKIKGAEYLRLAKILAHISPLSVWEALIAGSLEEYMQHIPEELRSDVEEISGILTSQFEKIKQFMLSQVDALGLAKHPRERNTLSKEERTRLAREVASIIQTCKQKWLQGLLYSYMSNGDWQMPVYKLIRPTNNKYVDIEGFLNKEALC
jgi:hypothetical protein